MDSAERDRLIGLLEANHAFPGPFFFSVITVNTEEARSAVRQAVSAGLPAPVPDDAWETRASGAGRYASHRVNVPCRSAEDVLALYDRVRGVAGVITLL